MRRRDALRVGGSAVLFALSGCTSGDDDGDDQGSEFDDPSPPWSQPNAVYHPGHESGMNMLDMARQGRRAVALTYTYTERFWTVTGARTQRVAVESEYNAIHLMASVWDAETGTVLPVDAGLRVAVERDGERLTERALWPMLSQQMGVHFGDNVEFPDEGEYTLEVALGESTVRRPDGTELGFERSDPLRFDFEFSRITRNRIDVSKNFDIRGEQAAMEPMDMGRVPLSVAPPQADLPGQVLGTGRSGDAVFLVTAAEDAGGTYVVVSPRTPYNRFVLQLMSLSMRVDRDGTAVFEGPLPAAIGPDRGYHYGAVVDALEPGDELTIAVDTPPQAARHAGYETAFLEMPDVTVTA